MFWQNKKKIDFSLLIFDSRKILATPPFDFPQNLYLSLKLVQYYYKEEQVHVFPESTLVFLQQLQLTSISAGVSKTQTSDPKNSDPLDISKTQTLCVSRKLRPSACLENSDPKKSR